MENEGGVTFQAAVAWGVLFLVFVTMTDIPATASLAAALAWLLFFSILFTYGTKAFETIRTVNTGTAVSTSSGNPAPSGIRNPGII